MSTNRLDTQFLREAHELSYRCTPSFSMMMARWALMVRSAAPSKGDLLVQLTADDMG